MKKVFTVLTVILGTMIGAGFASGRELLDFFAQYGKIGLWNTILVNSIFSIVIVMALKKQDMVGMKTHKNNILNGVLNRLTGLFSACSFCIMISAIGAFLEEQLQFPFWYGVIVASLIGYCLLMQKFQGIKWIHVCLVPLIIMGITAIFALGIPGSNPSAMANGEANKAVLSAFFYAGYHFLLLIPMLIHLQTLHLNYGESMSVGILFMVFNSSLMIHECFLLRAFYPAILSKELPNLYIASTVSEGVKWLYSFVMLGAILTTACSSGYHFLKTGRKDNYSRNAMLLCLFSFWFSKVGFARLIRICYPIFGILGWLYLVARGKRKDTYE